MSGIAIVGSGKAGTALHEAFRKAGRDAALAPRDAEGMRRAATAADIIVFAIPFDARKDAVATLGPALDGKVLVDVTNALRFPGPHLDLEGQESGAEELQRLAPRARVVKAFNTVFYPAMTAPSIGGERISVLVAGNDEGARRLVLDLARDAGFDAVDAGPLENARMLEELLVLEMRLEKMHGSRIGWRLLRE